jgi:hypothetical protein
MRYTFLPGKKFTLSSEDREGCGKLDRAEAGIREELYRSD